MNKQPNYNICWCGGDHQPINHKCMFCNRNHAKDLCVLCEKACHPPIKCPAMCYCLPKMVEHRTDKCHFKCVDTTVTHSSSNHICSNCGDKHIESKCQNVKCDCGRDHSIARHLIDVCKICRSIHLVEPCVICNETGHIPHDCPRACPCIIFVTIDFSTSENSVDWVDTTFSDGSARTHNFMARNNYCVWKINAHTVENHSCVICETKHFKDACVVCNEFNHSPVNCKELCPCIKRYKPAKYVSDDYNICIKKEEFHKKHEHKCHLCSNNHYELACPMTKKEILSRFDFLADKLNFVVISYNEEKCQVIITYDRQRLDCTPRISCLLDDRWNHVNSTNRILYTRDNNEDFAKVYSLPVYFGIVFENWIVNDNDYADTFALNWMKKTYGERFVDNCNHICN